MKEDTKGKSLLSRWKVSEKKKSQSTGIVRAPSDSKLLPSHGQQRLWFLQQLYPGNPVYNYSEIYTFKGNLNSDYLKQSLQAIYSSNTILRTSFKLVDGELESNVDALLEIPIEEFDLSLLTAKEKESEKKKQLMADAGRHFDLDDPPLLRVSLIKISGTEWVLAVTMHHIITDKWSMGLFREQMAMNYRQLSANGSIQRDPPELQFSDYAYWQQDQIPDPGQMEYWRNKLAGEIPYLNLPTDHVFTGNNTFRGAALRQQFSHELSDKVLSLSKALGTTPYVLLLSVYYLMLYRYSGQEDILVGTPISVRKGTALENMIGFFDETIVLRTKLTAGITFPELVGRVNETTLEAFANKDVPFDVLVRELKPERALGKNPFFRGMFMYHAVPDTPSFGPDVELEYTFLNSGVSKFDLTMYISNDNGILSSSFEYSTDLFEKDTILRFQEHYKILLQNIVQQPDGLISGIPMLTDREKEVFLPEKSSKTKVYNNFKGIHEIIETAGKERPEDPAVTFKEKVINYRELLQRADTMAQQILLRTKGNNEIVGLCMDRSVDMIIGLLAILKAGCAYLPIDPEYPAERVSYMIEDSKVPLVITQNGLTNVFATFEKTLLITDELPTEVGSPIPFPEADRRRMAYVIYTSGSTGKPKGVPITHGNIITSTAARLDFYKEQPGVFLLMSSIAFDSSKAGIFWTLCTGGNLVIAEKRLEQDMDKISEVIAENSVSHTLMLPSLYKSILEFGDISKLHTLNTAIVAGEACSPAVCEAHFDKIPETALYNEYGPTEATVWCIAHHIKKENIGDVIPIGKPVADAEIYLLNEAMQMVPFGAIGEIYIGGPGLAGKYLNDPSQTKEVYVYHPYNADPSAKLYKTGDLGRYLKDGSIQFLGRVDQQVKIRGFRIEMGEIENVFSNYQDIEQAVVLLEDVKGMAAATSNSAEGIENIKEVLESLDDEKQVEALIAEIVAMNDDEKKYLLRQIQL